MLLRKTLRGQWSLLSVIISLLLLRDMVVIVVVRWD
jgi:hypothetical protein